MDPGWNIENPYTGQWLKPKVIWVGRLVGSVNGRPMAITARDEKAIIELSSLRSAIALRRIWRSVEPLVQNLASWGLGTSIKLPGLPMFNVAPQPSWVLRWALP